MDLGLKGRGGWAPGGLRLVLGAAVCLVVTAGAGWGQAGTIPAASEGARTPVAVQQDAKPGAAPTAPAVVSEPAAAGQKATPLQQAADVEANKEGEVLAGSLWGMKGLRVEAVKFEGVNFSTAEGLPVYLEQKVGEPLDPGKVRASEKRLFATGRYKSIEVRGVRHGDAVTLVFAGAPRYFVGRVVISGVKQERLAAQLEYATKLQPGVPFVQTMVEAGADGVRQTLAMNGYYEPIVTAKTQADPDGHQVHITYLVVQGPQARVGEIALTGTDPGFTPEDFRSKGKLKRGSKVNRDTTSNALTRLRKRYQKNDRLEATVTLEKSTYNAPKKELDYSFNAHQGPTVKVIAKGVKIRQGQLKKLIPVFEEGAVDNDLMNEGAHNLREYYQRKGYFDVEVTNHLVGEGTPAVTVEYDVDAGNKHKVSDVTFKGNTYFHDDVLKERIHVQKADAYLRSGRFSQALLQQDTSTIMSLYRANGFSNVKVTPDTTDVDEANGKELRTGQVRVSFEIEEGPQQKFGPVVLDGVDASRVSDVKGLMNAQEGQPFSLITLSGDRDAVLGYYLSHGFDQARVEVRQQREQADAAKTDVTIHVVEGEQVFINRVLLSGVEKTRPPVVQRELRVQAGDPLDQSALLDTQRRLYNLALFNEVNTAVQNPTGDATRKNVIVQVTEARRWDVTYGFGFEAQTGNPHRGCPSKASLIQIGADPNSPCNPNGKTGASFRVSGDVSRINLFGTAQSLTLHTTYGFLEKIATLTYNNPHFFSHPNFSQAVSGGYSNVQNITTFAASTLQGTYKLVQKYKKTDTFIYDFTYRRVKVDANSLAVGANLVPLLSLPVQVGGPGITWFHDTRDPSPLDAHKGSYTSVQEFYAASLFGSASSFNRVDVSNSTYYQYGKRKYVLARNTRLGFETAFGRNPNAGNPACVGVELELNASCNPVPLPERLYAGGATSHRGFPINAAGPRDLQTGFPVGGTGAFVNTLELRLPAPTLPYVGDSVSFVVFHDMGNVFKNVSDIWPSMGKFKQPNQESCKVTTGAFGVCNFNYFSHAVGLGARYKTPIGPIRADFSYNLNPPVYPVILDFNSAAPHFSQASHFNFFFSIGQSF